MVLNAWWCHPVTAAELTLLSSVNSSLSDGPVSRAKQQHCEAGRRWRSMSLSMLTTHSEECGLTPGAQMNTPLEPSRAGGVAKRPLRRAIPGCRDQRSRDC